MMNIRRLGRDTLQTVTGVPLFQRIRSLQHLFVLTTRAAVLSETSADLYQTTRHHISENINVQAINFNCPSRAQVGRATPVPDPPRHAPSTPTARHVTSPCCIFQLHKHKLATVCYWFPWPAIPHCRLASFCGWTQCQLVMNLRDLFWCSGWWWWGVSGSGRPRGRVQQLAARNFLWNAHDCFTN